MSNLNFIQNKTHFCLTGVFAQTVIGPLLVGVNNLMFTQPRASSTGHLKLNIASSGPGYVFSISYHGDTDSPALGSAPLANLCGPPLVFLAPHSGSLWV